jgi:TonB family protein
MTREGKLWLSGSLAVSSALLTVLILLSRWAGGGRPAQTTRAISYNNIQICTDAFEQNFDFSDFKNNHFTIPLREGCFGGIVKTPSAWHSWVTEPSGDQNGFWYAIWIVGERQGIGPMFANDNRNLTYNKARFQGHGSLLFYTNDVLPIPTSPSQLPKSLQLQGTPQLDENGIYSVGNGVSEPVVIARVEPEYTDEARAVHFKDVVTVSVVVRVDGSIRDITFKNPPGYGLDEQIIQALGRWKFRPAQFNGYAVPVHADIHITFKTD